jgi:hypothetical protein
VPRQDFTLENNVTERMAVWVISLFKEEVLCIDKDKTHRLELDSKQKNAAKQEACWENDPQWRVVEDPDGIVTNQGPWSNNPFLYRLRVEPRGKETYITVEAELDGVLSHPWQALSFYEREPLKILTMSASDIAKRCTCTFHGNARYSGSACPK